MWYVLVFALLTFCSNAETTRKPAKIEHITRKNITEQYKFESKPYVEESVEEPLFEKEEFYSPALEQQAHLQHKLSQQEEIEKLAKMKRAGRLSQKDYNAKVAAIHARKKQETEMPCEKETPPIETKSPSSPEPSVEKPSTETKPSPKPEYKIESLKIHPEDEIWDD